MSNFKSKSDYDQITVINIVDEDFYWRYDYANVEEDFLLEKGEELTLSRAEAMHLVEALVTRAIDKYESYEVDVRGKLELQFGGQLQLDQNLRNKYREMAIGGVRSLAAPKKKSEGQKLKEVLSNKNVADGFDGLNEEVKVSEAENYKNMMQKVKSLGLYKKHMTKTEMLTILQNS